MATRLAAVVALCIASAVFAEQCLSHLRAVGTSQEPDRYWLLFSAVAVVVAVVFVLLIEVATIHRRFRTPERQIRLAMQRVRAGDVGFRIGLRRGEPLARLARECNGLLEWLNHNPPAGVRVDGDVFELEGKARADAVTLGEGKVSR